MASAQAMSGTFLATVYPTTGASPPLTVSRFTSAQTPGNVAVCLSGQTCSWEPLRLWCAKKVGFFQKISS
jgi:hypothetical protein